MIRLISYGDSWTEGVGCNSKVELKITNVDERRAFRLNYSWPYLLSKLLNVKCDNRGISGSSNNQIFNKIVSDIMNREITSDDFVIIMWSSTLRDQVSFFPNGQWHVWSKHYIEDSFKKTHFIDVKKTQDNTYNNFLSKYKDFYITNLFNQTYYNIINQNYIIFLQELFNEYKIKYLFIDAFDSMIQSPNETELRLDLIEKNNYWEFGTKTIRDFLINVGDSSVWESASSFKKIPNKHPSARGYKLISEMLYNYLNDKKETNEL